jgi:hypothetical protein
VTRATSAVRVALRELATLEDPSASASDVLTRANAYAVRIATALGDEDLAGELRELARIRAMVRAGRAPALAQVQRAKGGAR